MGTTELAQRTGPFYAGDTDSMATGRLDAVETVRDWWRGRARGRDRAVAIAADWGADTHPHWGFNADPRHLGHYHDAARGHRDFIAYIDDGLESYLRGYLFWLERRREPHVGEPLPHL